MAGFADENAVAQRRNDLLRRMKDRIESKGDNENGNA